MPGPDKGHGSGIFAKVKTLEAIVKDHGERLDGHDQELAEIDADVLALSEICARSHQRAAARLRLARIRARRAK